MRRSRQPGGGVGDARGESAGADCTIPLALSAILNGRAGIRPEMAIRLSIAFKTSAESWLNQQVQYDLWQAEKLRKTLRVARLRAKG